MGPAEQWLPAVMAIAAWPIVTVLIVVLVLMFVPRDRQLAMLSAITELIRAARSPVTSDAPPAATSLSPAAPPVSGGLAQPVELPVGAAAPDVAEPSVSEQTPAA